MSFYELISPLAAVLAAFPWSADSIQPEALQELLEQKLCGSSIAAASSGEKDMNELLPSGYSLLTGLYEGVVGELPAMLFLSGQGGDEPFSAAGGDALPNHLSQGGKLFLGNAVAVKEAAEAFEGSHGGSQAGNLNHTSAK